MEAQRKKKIKNKARLPRTAGLRTLTDLTTDLTKAGIDPSRIQERAVMIAKVRAAGSKRKRDEDGMDVDGDGNGDDEDGDNWVSEGDGQDETMMDVDGYEGEEDGTRHKRGKANSGAAIAHRKRAPRSNRQLAGMRDEAVRCCCRQHHTLSSRPSIPFSKGADERSCFYYSKYPKRHDYGILDSAGVTCLRKRARATALSESKWCVCVCFFYFGNFLWVLFIPILGLDTQCRRSYYSYYFFLFLCFIFDAVG